MGSPVPVYVRTHNLFTTGDGTPALKWGSSNACGDVDAHNHAVNLPRLGVSLVKLEW